MHCVLRGWRSITLLRWRSTVAAAVTIAGITVHLGVTEMLQKRMKNATFAMIVVTHDDDDDDDDSK